MLQAYLSVLLIFSPVVQCEINKVKKCVVAEMTDGRTDHDTPLRTVR